MYKSKLFHLTRLRLTGCYVGVMATILSLGGIAFYGMMAQAHWHALHQELESVAGTLHDGLEPNLKQPGKIEPSIQQLVPGLCLTGTTCAETKQRHVLGTVQQEGYYARFLTQSGQLVATVGYQPEQLPFIGGDNLWQTLKDPHGQRYHHISLLLKTANSQPWGYLQVGRSLKEFDNHLATTGWLLLIGLPLVMLLITGASWWLAGLAMQPVYQSYQQIQQFTADAAHELRTPLAATKATVESTLEIEPLTVAEAKSTLFTIERQNNRLIQLVQDLLLLSRMDLQVLSLKVQPVKLNTLITDVVDEFEALAIAAGLSLMTEVLSHQPVTVFGDEDQLYRLVANLVTNAIQYTCKGGKITIRLNKDEKHALLQVQDTGIGIPEAEQTRIFDRFYRVNSDRSRAQGGSGLGLAIAQAIAQTHQGYIFVQSVSGNGSIFTLQLPLLPQLRSR
ncbi:cell wall metabolism sensor histidine kinase WalK (plasmid) [Kovacikia minuta CCNUW1]|uniref:two-component system sensor histidine kinase RppB n=1 Tax=Kovacikia minuta TaxID=2931930 RepID=UPI001CCD6ADB|nr:two-component system sensor histidine kinase RppB [Kovacikia minuta]UBF30281.1 cell wall metabolism sensor histidine kinase WalK [Kovacikia minuta CCNUW1]